MKTKTINLYSFRELSEEAQQKAIEKFWDINVSYEWWEYTFEDAERIGLKLTEFDLDRYRGAKGHFLTALYNVYEIAQLIQKEHGEACETYKIATQFIKDWDNAVTEHSDGIDLDKVAEDKEYDFDQVADNLENEFLKSLLEDYSIILQKEFEYLTSKEAIIESIEANEYTFTENGELEN